MSDKIKTGAKGENLAAEFLQANGFEIVARNFRHKHAEIDLIAQRENWLLFIEVKTRTSTSYGQPEDFVDHHKSRNVFEAAEEYIFANDWQGHIRFDIISVKLGYNDHVEIAHFEDAIN